MKSDKYYFELAAKQARKSLCERGHCGSVVVSVDGQVIGKGYNAPPLNDTSQKYCNTEFDLTLKPKYDKTCCVHAEWNAIIDAFKNHSDKVEGATLYFMRVDDDGNWTDAGDPFCTICSRLALQSGLAHFALWVDGRPKVYTTANYNRESYDFYQ
jgi:hypothetical protein